MADSAHMLHCGQIGSMSSYFVVNGSSQQASMSPVNILREVELGWFRSKRVSYWVAKSLGCHIAHPDAGTKQIKRTTAASDDLDSSGRLSAV